MDKVKLLFASLLLVSSAFAQSPYATITGVIQGPNGLPAANDVISLSPTQTFFVNNGGNNCAYDYLFQINAVSLTPCDTINFNNTTPSAPSNGVNVTFQTSKSGTTDSVSAALVGNGNASMCLSGAGTYVACSGGGGGGGGNPLLENCTSDQTGNSFPQVTSLTNWFSAHWEFLFNTTTYINCEVYIPSAQSGATIVVDVFSADSTAGHTALIQTCDAQITTGTLNVGALTCASSQTYTTTSTAYSRTSLTFNVQSTLVNNGILAVKIGTSPTGTAPTSDLIILPHFVL